MARRCSWRLADRNVTMPASMPRSPSSEHRRCVQRKQCCAVLERESTTTGTPSSTLRSTLRERSRKLEKFDTHATKAADLLMRTTPAFSSSRRASARRRSTAEASTVSTISVTPSCLPKSTAWLATSTAAHDEPGASRSASRARTGPRMSAAGGVYVRTWSITASTCAGDASTRAPLVRPKASTVATCLPPPSTSPRRTVTIGSAVHAEVGSPRRSISVTASARRRSA
mmetsp:Transcript_19101/g.51356  ORF Transcript_19101/g.51356 Transcript_19101/m.51356 type:complete len:228 (+) Transcript_19101:1959-2642(+)